MCSLDFKDPTGFIPSPESHQKRERLKARQLRKTRWWMQKLACRTCYYCQCYFSLAELTMDHKIPVCRGGFSTRSNVVVCCKPCNSKKKYASSIDLVLEKLQSNSHTD